MLIFYFKAMIVVDSIYENGVFKPLKKVDLKDKTRVKLIVEIDKREIVERFAGILGKAEINELKKIEQDVQSQ